MFGLLGQEIELFENKIDKLKKRITFKNGSLMVFAEKKKRKIKIKRYTF